MHLCRLNLTCNFVPKPIHVSFNISLKVHNWGSFCPKAIVYSYLKFKLKNLKSFSTRVEELFKPLVLQRNPTGFCFFKSIFLRNGFLSNARWFYGKKRKFVKGNLHLTSNRLSRNKTLWVADNYNYMCHICAKGFLNSNFNQAFIDKISNFHKIALYSTFSQNINL